MGQSAIKGTGISSVVEDLLRIIGEGALPREEVDAMLEPDDLSVLDAKIMAASWYSIETYARMVKVMAHVEGGDDLQAYVVQRGRDGARRISASGIYSQLRATREMYGNRLGQVMASLAPALYRDTSVVYAQMNRKAESGYFLRMSVPSQFPDICRFGIQGFVEYMTQTTRSLAYTVTSERTAKDLITFWARPT